jgi:predicted dehydrogenase
LRTRGVLHTPQQQHQIGVTIIGAGERGAYYIGARMAEIAAETGFRIVSVHDALPDRARHAADHLTAIYADKGIAHTVMPEDGMEAAITDPAVGLVLVTTHTDAHREPVEIAARAGKRIYLDKPISVTLADAEAILRAEAASSPVMMGFTRRYEKPWIEAVDLAHKGRIGDPQMILLRSVIPYTRYLQLWHRNQSKSGGAINDKCSHHFDVLNWIAGARPVSVSAIGGRSGIFAPDPDAPPRCSQCERVCPYRRHQTLVDKFEGVGRVANDSWTHAHRIEDRNDNCVFLPGADIDDHAIISVAYENGMTACLFFTIFGPWAADQETLEIVGASGRLRMERHSGSIDIVSAHGHKAETVTFTDPERQSTHFGADLELVRTMRAFCAGATPPVGPGDGLSSLRMVHAALWSLRNGGQPIDPARVEDAP